MPDIILEGRLTKFKLTLKDKSVEREEIMQLGIEGMKKYNLDTIQFNDINYVIDVGKKVKVYINPDSRFNKNLKYIGIMFAYRIILPSKSEIINEIYK